jgi:hypothetical protein
MPRRKTKKSKKQKKATQNLLLSNLERLPDVVLQKIITYLDNSKFRLLASSKTMEKQVVDYFSVNHHPIWFENLAQFDKFIQTKPAYQNKIKNLHLSADVTDAIFPFPKNYNLQFSFFSVIKKNFPSVANIYLELKYLYMLSMMMNDPDFKSSVHLIKRITTKIRAHVPEEILGLIKIKYGEGQENFLSMSDANIYLRNSNLTRKVLAELGNFTALSHLSLSPSGAIRCDYEDLDQLLGQLLDLRILELNLESDLTLDHTTLFNSDEAKPYHVMAEPPKDPKNYSNRIICYPLKDYPNITTLTLSGNYIPDSFLSHFSNLKHLTIDKSLSEHSSDKHLANKALRLLESLVCPKKLVSLQIPASIPLISNIDPFTLDFRASPLNQLAKILFNLEKITITSSKDHWEKDIKITHSGSLFPSHRQHEAYLLPRVHELSIHYGQYHTYYSGTLNSISQSFPNLLNLIFVKENLEQAVASDENSINENKLIAELQDALKKNLWRNIKIHLYNFSENIKLLFPNAEFSENKLTISISSCKEEQAITSKFFSAVSVSNASTTEPKEDLVTKLVKK